MNKIKALSRRDPEFFSIDEKKIMLIACDSCGGIGRKESDVLDVSNEIVGSLTARVPLMELLSLGSDIKTVSLTIINEVSPTANQIISGVKSELVNYDVKYVISTEKNMKTTMTGVGVTVIAMIEKEKLRLSTEDVYCISVAGTPSVGSEVLMNKDIIFNQAMISKLLDDSDVLEIIPCGSGGVNGELSRLDPLKYLLYKDCDIFNKSCGPSTAALVLSKVDISNRYSFLKSVNGYL